MQKELDLRRGEKAIKMVVGMGTCGIAAGARQVMAAIRNELALKRVENVTINQTGCAGFCEQEPIVDVYWPGKERVTYGKVDPEKARRIVNEHILGGQAVKDLVLAKEK